MAKRLIYSVFERTILAQTDFTFKMARRKRKRGKKDGDAAEDATEHEMGEGEDAPMPKKGTGKGKCQTCTGVAPMHGRMTRTNREVSGIHMQLHNMCNCNPFTAAQM